MQKITAVEDTAHSTPRAVPRRRNVLLFTAIVLFAIPLLVTLHSKEKTIHSLGENRFTILPGRTRNRIYKGGSRPSVGLVDGAFCYRELGPAPELAPLL